MAEGSIFPGEGEWYKDSISQLRQVVAYYENYDVIEVQLFEGKVTEFIHDSWNQLETELVEAPEHWSDPFYERVADDMGNTETPTRLTNWNNRTDEMGQED